MKVRTELTLQVLPPWGPLPHWRSNDVGDQTGLPWRRFFDVESLNRFTPVVELRDLGAKTPTMDRVMRLRAFDEVPSGRWEEKHRIVECAGHATRTCDADVDGVSHCRFWGWHQVALETLFQGNHLYFSKFTLVLFLSNVLGLVLRKKLTRLSDVWSRFVLKDNFTFFHIFLVSNIQF